MRPTRLASLLPLAALFPLACSAARDEVTLVAMQRQADGRVEAVRERVPAEFFRKLVAEKQQRAELARRNLAPVYSGHIRPGECDGRPLQCLAAFCSGSDLWVANVEVVDTNAWAALGGTDVVGCFSEPGRDPLFEATFHEVHPEVSVGPARLWSDEIRSLWAGELAGALEGPGFEELRRFARYEMVPSITPPVAYLRQFPR